MITKSSLHRLFFSLVAFLLLATLVTSAPVSAAGGADYELTDEQFKEFNEFIIETDKSYPEFSNVLFESRSSAAKDNQERLIKALDLYDYKNELTNLDQAKIDYLSSMLEKEKNAIVEEKMKDDDEFRIMVITVGCILAIFIVGVIITEYRAKR